MELIYIFIVAASLLFLFVVAIYAFQNRSVAGSRAFLMQIACVTIWSIGALMEMLSPNEQAMLFWRNIEQIGVFLLPAACVYFAVDYSQFGRLKKYIPLLLIVSVGALVLIFTDASTHLMRTGYTISSSRIFGKALSVHQTLLGKILVAYNYLLALISLAILFVFSRQIAKHLRRQVILILIATGLVFVLGLLKAAFLEGTQINIPVVTIYLPGGIILFYNLYRNNFFRVSPIARDKVFDIIELGIVVTDGSGMIADSNPCAAELLSRLFQIKTNPIGKKFREIFLPFPQWVRLTQQSEAGEVELMLSGDDPHFVQIRVFPLLSQNNVQVGAVSIMRDVTDLRLQEFALKVKAETDSLTGLMNRESFLELFSQRLRESAITGAAVSLLMMDLDKFKDINDTYGHGTGDRVLVAFASILKDTLRHEDAVARIGGDEFVAMLPGVGKEGAIEIANRILNAANDTAVDLDALPKIRVNLSIGICDNANICSVEEILRCADAAMYLAKNREGSHCAIWE